MGFRNGAYATVWEVRPTKSPKVSIARISISKKKGQGDGYDDVFSHWIKFAGKAKEVADTITGMTRVKIDGCDVEAKWNAEKGVCDYDFVVFECERVDGATSGATPAAKNFASKKSHNDEGDVDEDEYIPF